jgi:septin family protein
MTIFKALQKIDALTKEELKHCIQRMNIEIDNYKICCKNYSPDDMKRFGIPYKKSLMEQRKKFIKKLKQL